VPGDNYGEAWVEPWDGESVCGEDLYWNYSGGVGSEGGCAVGCCDAVLYVEDG
jgi:hypothetical protein